MIKIEQLSKSYGSFKAVDNLSLSIEEGEIFGFLGVNGAGKTTTLRMLSGILKPTSGKINLSGFDIDEQPREAKALTGFIPDRPHLYTKLTALEFLAFVGNLYSVPPDLAVERAESLLHEYRLDEWRNELIESFSHGMRQRLATCAALIHQPKILIVDEPMVGLDPHGAKMLKENFKRYARSGMTIILSTHSLNVAEEVSDRLAIINRGALLGQGTLQEIRALAGGKELGLEQLFLELTAATSL